MKQQNKFKPEQQHEQVEQQLTQNAVKEFATVDDLLRFDASQTAVPSGIADRLQKSSADIPSPSRPWWQRLFKR
jgi:hypothetical protein